MKLVFVLAVCVTQILAGVLPPNLEIKNNDVSKDGADPVQRVFEEEILAILESVRDIMINGNDDVPVLDPFELESLSIDLRDLGLQNGEVNINDASVRGASTFQVNSLSLSLLTQRLTFDISIPSLEIEAGNYNFEISESGVNLYGNGPGKLVINNAGLSGTVAVRIGIITGITVSGADVVLRIGNVESALEGLLGGSAAGNFINSIIEQLVPELVNSYQSDISTFLNDLIVGVANDLLQSGNTSIFKQIFTVFPGILDAIIPSFNDQ